MARPMQRARAHEPEPERADDAQRAPWSSVGQMFDGRSIFITGASGFIGRVLLEKLLRSYHGIRRVYILLRAKKNLAPSERLHKHLLRVPIFDRIRSMDNGRELLDKIVVVAGDIGEANLGISERDLDMLLQDDTLSIVFHSAATVKFDEPLRTSIKFNLVATKVVIDLCKRIKNLVCLCHVSTAYVNSDLKDNRPIEEKLYPIEQRPDQLIKLAEILDEDLMQTIKPKLVGERPNTYTYTKALAEHLIALEAAELPVAIVRPSIVVASWKEPISGWVDNLNGPTGLILAIGKGLLRSMYVSRSVVADIIPVDIVVNTMVAASFYVAKTSNKLRPRPLALSDTSPDGANSTATGSAAEFDHAAGRDEPDERATSGAGDPSKSERLQAAKTPPIFHCTSGDLNPITWGQMEDMFFPIIRHYPSQQVLRYPFGSFKANKYHDLATRIIVHYLPALFIDLLCLIMGKKRQLLSIYYKLHCATAALSHFCTTNYNFKSHNIRLLESSLNDKDKQSLCMDVRPLNWYNFWEDYVLGARRFVLKEEDHTLEESRRAFKRAYYVEMGFRTLLVILASACCAPLVIRLASVYV